MMSAALMSLWLLTWTGCAHYRVVSQDKTLRRLKAGASVTPAIDGWFVPDALYQEMREAIGNRIESLEPKP
jgi:hypothetical protein